jgi:hypothetical protein
LSNKIIQQNAILVGIVILAMSISFTYFNGVRKTYTSIDSFASCVEAGFIVTNTYPEKCVLPGKVFINLLQKKADGIKNLNSNAQENIALDYRNLNYLIDGQEITLHNGIGQLPPNLRFKQATTTVIATGTVVLFDINNDMATDTIFLLQIQPVGTQKSAWYITSAITLYKGLTGTNAVYVGETVIAPALIYKNGQIVLTYKASSTEENILQKNFTFDKDKISEIKN